MMWPFTHKEYLHAPLGSLVYGETHSINYTEHNYNIKIFYVGCFSVKVIWCEGNFAHRAVIYQLFSFHVAAWSRWVNVIFYELCGEYHHYI